jgi:carbon storage regulator
MESLARNLRFHPSMAAMDVSRETNEPNLDGRRIQGGIVMLVLSRKVGQGFRLGEDIRITVVKTDRNSVRIGIDAPDGISIRRDEIVEIELDQPEHRHPVVGVV